MKGIVVLEVHGNREPVGSYSCSCMHLAITGCSLMGGRWLPSGYYHLSEPKLWDYMLRKDQQVHC